MGFSETIEKAKQSIDDCESNAQLLTYVKSVADSATRFANKLKEKRFGGVDWINPVGWFREFWAPVEKQVVVEWEQVETAARELRSYIATIPNDSSEPDRASAKTYVVRTMSAIQTVFQFQTDTDGQLEKALITFGNDVANAPRVLGQAIRSGGEIIASRIITPLSEGLTSGIWALVKSLVSGLWWLFLLAALVIVGAIALARAGGIAGIAARLANG